MSDALFSAQEGQVIVAHPGAQHSHYLAAALQEQGLLQYYVTGLYMGWSQPPFSALRWLPDQHKAQLEASTFARFRRSYAGLDEKRVRAIQPLGESFIAVAQRLRVPERYRKRLGQRLSLKFQRDLARFAMRARPSAIVCYDTNAFETFTKLRGAGISLTLDQSTAHASFHERLLGEERQLKPEFADTITLPSGKTPWYPRWCREAEDAHWVLAGSNFVKATLVDAGVSEDKIRVINYGVDTELFQPRYEDRPDDRFTVLFAGSIIQRKGIAYLLEAVESLDLPGLDLVLCGGVVGSGEGLRRYSRYFRYLSHLPHRSMPKVYGQADVFVLPSLVEGLSLVVLEALASGLPVITTANSGAGDLLTDGVEGFLVPIRSSEAIADRLSLLYRNRDLCRRMGQAARQTALSHSWKHYGQQVADFYRERTASG